MAEQFDIPVGSVVRILNGEYTGAVGVVDCWLETSGRRSNEYGLTISDGAGDYNCIDVPVDNVELYDDEKPEAPSKVLMNGAYDLQLIGSSWFILDVQTPSTAVAVINSRGRFAMRALEGVKSAILFDGGSLFDVAMNRYVVGTMDQLMHEGR